MNAIDIQHLTKDYGQGRGVFDITLKIKEGEVYGYLGRHSLGGPGSMMTWTPSASKAQPGAEPQSFTRTVHPSGSMACW